MRGGLRAGVGALVPDLDLVVTVDLPVERFIEIRDDGIGGANPAGNGLVGIEDRVSALGGQLRVECPACGGTVVSAVLPIADQRVPQQTVPGSPCRHAGLASCPSKPECSDG
jgi:hypothetical protein